MTRLYFICALLLLGSCSFNKIFLHPYELNDESNFQQITNGDTLFLTFDDKQPVFVNHLDDTLYTNIESHFFAGTQGDSINGWLMRPELSNGRSIFFVHGNAGNLVYQFKLAEPFVELGYTVFLFDYSGFGFSQGKANRKNAHQSSVDAFDYFLTIPEIKNTDIVMYGQSLGGHMAMVLADQVEKDIKGLVIEGAFSSHKGIANDRVPVLGKIFVREMYSAKKTAPDVGVPVLIVHSRADKVIPIKHGRILYEQSNEPKEFLEIDSAHVRGPLYYKDIISNKIDSLIFGNLKVEE